MFEKKTLNNFCEIVMQKCLYTKILVLKYLNRNPCGCQKKKHTVADFTYIYFKLLLMKSVYLYNIYIYIEAFTIRVAHLELGYCNLLVTRKLRVFALFLLLYQYTCISSMSLKFLILYQYIALILVLINWNVPRTYSMKAWFALF